MKPIRYRCGVVGKQSGQHRRGSGVGAAGPAYRLREPGEENQMTFTQHCLASLSHASYLLGDDSTRRAVVVDPRRDVVRLPRRGGGAWAAYRTGHRDTH
jgi:hypothetical protein